MDRLVAGRKSGGSDRTEKLKPELNNCPAGSAPKRRRRRMGRKGGIEGALAALLLACAMTPALAQKQYDPGADDTEIKIGTTTPYSGPASAYSAGAVSITAYFAMINDQGGVNGRKINYISLDDAYSPPKTVEQIRRLIESEEVLF